MIPVVNLKRMHEELRGQLLHAVEDTLLKSDFIGGSSITEFENNFANLIGTRFCVSCANGTDAIHIALSSMKLKPGDEVIVPSMSWISTSEVLSLHKAKPVFVDINPDTYCIDVNKLRSFLTERTVGIIPVHLYGHPADMVELCEFAKENGLWVIEDCAQAHLAKVDGRNVGTFGDVATFSFFPGKNLGALGDAGAVVTNNAVKATFMRRYANHGQKQKHIHCFDGINSRLDGIQAKFLTIKLPHLEGWNRKRKQVAARYNEELNSSLILKKPYVKENVTHAWHLYSLQVKNRQDVVMALRKAGVSTSTNYPNPLTRLRQYKYEAWDDKEALVLSQNIVNLPMCPSINDDEVSTVISAFNNLQR